MEAVGNVYRRSDRRYGPGGRLEEADGTRFEHDADGNQVLRVEPDGARWRYCWDGAGMLREVERPDGRRVRMAYDAFARRVSKQVVVGADGEAEAIESETRFVWNEHNGLHELGSDAPPTTWYWEPDTFTPVMKRQAGAWHGVASDHLGTPTEMYDEAGELAWSMQLDVFGVARFGAGEAGDCPWRWPGQYEDGETGLAQNRFRYYAAADARFVSADPIGLLGGTHSYAYPKDSLSWVDPFGLSARQLRVAMRRAGRPLNPGQTPHHVVHENSGNIWSQRSRELLARNGIDVNGEANGAALWGTADSQVARPLHPGRDAARSVGTYHAGNHLHTHGSVDDAARMIYRTLQEAERRGNVEDVLRDIGRRMEDGSWRSTTYRAGAIATADPLGVATSSTSRTGSDFGFDEPSYRGPSTAPRRSRFIRHAFSDRPSMPRFLAHSTCVRPLAAAAERHLRASAAPLILRPAIGVSAQAS